MSELGPVMAIAQRDFMKLLRDRPRLVTTLAFPLLLIGVLGGSLQALNIRVVRHLIRHGAGSSRAALREAAAAATPANPPALRPPGHAPDRRPRTKSHVANGTASKADNSRVAHAIFFSPHRSDARLHKSHDQAPRRWSRAAGCRNP